MGCFRGLCRFPSPWLKAGIDGSLVLGCDGRLVSHLCRLSYRLDDATVSADRGALGFLPG